MKINKFWISVVFISILFTILLATMVFAQEVTDSQPDGSKGQPHQETLVLSDDSNPDGTPEIQIPEQFRPGLTTATNVDMGTAVYFTPQDENTSTTVLFLYNTSNVTATVGIETFQLNGSQFIDTDVAVPPGQLVRICGDTVSTISASWQDTILINLTTSSTYARMTLPEGVKADGYVVWNGSSTYDPLQEVPTLPLRLSTDPLTVFLPTTLSN